MCTVVRGAGEVCRLNVVLMFVGDSVLWWHMRAVVCGVGKPV